MINLREPLVKLKIYINKGLHLFKDKSNKYCFWVLDQEISENNITNFNQILNIDSESG